MRNRRAFTLVELLVVIGIIALLISILLPTLSRAKQSANSLWCMNNLHEMGLAMEMYTHFNQGSYPVYYAAGITDWRAEIMTYIKHGASGAYTDSDSGNLWAMFKDKDTDSGPSSGLSGYNAEHVQTYSVLTAIFRYAAGPLKKDLNPVTSITGGPGEKPLKFGQIHRPTEMVMIMDAAQIGNEGLTGGVPWSSDADFDLMQGNGVLLSTALWFAPKPVVYCATTYPLGVDAGLNKDYTTYNDMYNDSGAYGALGNDMRFRHMRNTQSNALFVDGHVEAFHYKHPGQGGSDIQWKNIVLDDYRTQDLIFAPGQHP